MLNKFYSWFHIVPITLTTYFIQCIITNATYLLPSFFIKKLVYHFILIFLVNFVFNFNFFISYYLTFKKYILSSLKNDKL